MIEGLRCMSAAGVEVTLLLHEPLCSDTGVFFAQRHRDTVVLPGFSIEHGRDRTLWSRLRRHVARVATVRRTLGSLAPDIIITESPAENLLLWIYSVARLVKLPRIATFIHGSPFQFPDEITKYALIHRRAFREIRDGDAVYAELIPDRAPRIGLRRRLSLELYCLASWFSVRMASLIFVLSKKNQWEVAKLYDVGTVRVVSAGGYSKHELQSGTACPAAQQNGGYVLSVCRLVRKKRVDLVLRAFAAFVASNPGSDVDLVVAGTGPEGDRLRELAQALKLEGRIKFVGFVPDERLKELYGGCAVFISADNADYDLTVMAALGMGRPVVVTAQYDFPRQLNRVRRLAFVGSPDAPGLAVAISQALGAPASDLQAQDRGELEDLTWESYFDGIVGHLRDVASA